MPAHYRLIKESQYQLFRHFHRGKVSFVRREAPKGKIWVRYEGDNFPEVIIPKSPPVIPQKKVAVITRPDLRGVFDEIAGKFPDVVRPSGALLYLRYRVPRDRAHALTLTAQLLA